MDVDDEEDCPDISVRVRANIRRLTPSEAFKAREGDNSNNFVKLVLEYDLVGVWLCPGVEKDLSLGGRGGGVLSRA